MTKTCPACNSEADVSGVYCPRCNQRLDGRSGSPEIDAQKARKRRFFWLVTSIMVPIVLVTGFFLLVPPACSYYGEPVWRSTSRNNLKQIGMGLHNYEEIYMSFPAGGVYRGNVGYHSWMTQLLPHVEQAPLYNQINFNIPYDHAVNAAVFARKIPGFINPGIRTETNTNRLGRTHYAANVRLLSANSATRFKDITDGTSHTILAGEILNKRPAWGAPDNFRDPALGINRLPHGFGGPFKGGTHVLLADGAVRFLSEDISRQTLRRLADPSDGEDVGDY